jgi:hypothetical protein
MTEETKASNVPMILGIVGFVLSLPGILCATLCAGAAKVTNAALTEASNAANASGSTVDPATAATIAKAAKDANAAVSSVSTIGAYIVYVFAAAAIVGFVFSFLAKSKAKVAGLVLIGCAVLLIVTSIYSFNIWGLLTTACYLIAGIFALKQ